MFLVVGTDFLGVVGKGPCDGFDEAACLRVESRDVGQGLLVFVGDGFAGGFVEVSSLGVVDMSLVVCTRSRERGFW